MTRKIQVGKVETASRDGTGRERCRREHHDDGASCQCSSGSSSPRFFLCSVIGSGRRLGRGKDGRDGCLSFFIGRVLCRSGKRGRSAGLRGCKTLRQRARQQQQQSRRNSHTFFNSSRLMFASGTTCTTVRHACLQLLGSRTKGCHSSMLSHSLSNLILLHSRSFVSATKRSWPS